MKIEVNKDLEKDFKIEIFKGLDKPELIGFILAIIAGFGIGFGVYKMTGISLMYSIYFGFPAMIGLMLLCVKKFQGLSLYALYKKRIKYYLKTRKLIYHPGETDNQEYFVFSTRKERKK